MKNIILLILLFKSIALTAQTNNHKLPQGFVYIDAIIPNIELDIRYYGNNNFIGAPVKGYIKPKAILTRRATEALLKVEKELNTKNLGLKIFDAYRPQLAVNHFQEWAKDKNDTLTRSTYYPRIEKRNLFKDGYIASKSGHSRGSTVDLTIINLTDKKELDMGTIFDFLDPKSAHHSTQILGLQKKNRLLLKNTMEKHGFKAYSKEWWHYTYLDEPYKKTYFDFLVQ